MTGSADVSARPIAEAGNFRRRSDGDWDYFPRLTSPYGYHVSLAQREALERLERVERGAGWGLGFFIVSFGQRIAGKGIEGGLWVVGMGLLAWCLAVIAHRLIRRWMLRNNTRVPIPLSEDEIEAIESAGASMGAADMLVTVMTGGIGGMVVALLKQAGVHGWVAWVSAIALGLGLWVALTLVWADLSRSVAMLHRRLQGRHRS